MIKLFGKKDIASVQESIQILGHPARLDTVLCLVTAAERSVPVQVESENVSDTGKAPLGKEPVLISGPFSTSGALSVMTYLDSRAAARIPSLNPRKAALLGLQNYWIDLAEREVRSSVLAANDGLLESDDKLKAAYASLDSQLRSNEYIAGGFSFADLHWLVYTHFCTALGFRPLADTYPNVRAWFQRVCALRPALSRYLPMPADIRALRTAA